MFTTAKIAFTFTSLSVVQIYALTLVIIAYWCLACIKDLEVAAFWVSKWQDTLKDMSVCIDSVFVDIL